MTEGKGGLGGGVFLVIGLLIVVVIVVALAGGLGLGTDRQAQRLEAKADLARAQAAADSERAATRQMERDAAQERALAWLPYLVAILGGVLLAGLGGLLFWDLRTQRQAQGGTDAAILLELRRLELAQAERDRAMWRVLARMERGRLTSGGREVILYGEGERR